MTKQWRYIENEGALFRTTRLMNEFPEEIWSLKAKKFVPYEGKVPKPYLWGAEITQDEAEAWMRGDYD